MKKICFSILLMAIFTHEDILKAQFYLTGESPAAVTWEKIETAGFKIVYPEEMDQEANYFANLLEFYKTKSGIGENANGRKTPIIIHNASVLSNGFVAWTPKRMEIVATPSQSSYAQDWLSQLAVHEYRHVAQINALNNGFTRAFSVFTGQIAVGITSAMIPQWLYEGDAVRNETQLSQTGRGRDPSFEMPLRTQILENPVRFSYDKAVFGSYRDYVPDHYQYGYQIVSYANEKYGKEIWQKAFRYTGRNMFLISPLAVYLKNNYGIDKSQLYEEAMDSIKSLYNNIKDSYTYTKYSSLIQRQANTYTNYTHPQFMGEDQVVAIKSSIDDVDKLVVIDHSGQEKEILIPGLTEGIGLSASDNCIVWDEIARDPRWENRTYSEIRLLDMATGDVEAITKKSRYFSPDLSSDSQCIVAIETDLANSQWVVVIKTQSGDVAKRIPVTEDYALQTPRWTNNNTIIAVAVSKLGKKIVEVDPETETWETILPFTWQDVAEPVSYKNYVIFSAGYSGLDNLFAVDRHSKAVYQITSSHYGARFPEISPDASKLVYADYTINGFDVAAIPLNENSWIPVGWKEEKPQGIWFREEQDTVPPLYLQVPEKQYESRPYRKGLNVFQVHSWLPFYMDVSSDFSLDDLRVLPGLMLFSQNLLGTSVLTMGYNYSNGIHSLNPSYTWRGWYPVFEISGSYKLSSSLLHQTENASATLLSDHSYEIKTYLPLIFNRGKMIKQFQPYIEFQHANTSYTVNEVTRQGVDYLHSILYFSYYRRMSTRDLYPRVGTYVTLKQTSTPLNQNLFGNMMALETGIYLPGIGGHHHIVSKIGWQKQHLKSFYLPFHLISFPRGYAKTVSKEMFVIASNYALPVAYPDWSIKSVLYLKRIRANLFFDYAYGTDILEYHSESYVPYTGKYFSCGMELTADFHPFRFIFPVSAGIRMGFLPKMNQGFAEFLLSLDTNI